MSSTVSHKCPFFLSFLPCFSKIKRVSPLSFPSPNFEFLLFHSHSRFYRESLCLLKFPLEYLSAAAKSLQSCPTLCDPIDGSPTGSSVPEILQAWILEWVAISFSNAWKWKVKVKSLSRVQLLETPWTVAYQAPLSMGFSRQEHWSGLPLSSPMFHPTCFQIIFLYLVQRL